MTENNGTGAERSERRDVHTLTGGELRELLAGIELPPISWTRK